MKTATRLLVLATVLLFSPACAGAMDKLNEKALASQKKSEPTPEPGKALVVFLNNRSGTERSFIYDGDAYIGLSEPGTKFAYSAEPGEHLFMLASSDASFMGANLNAGKTYYVEIDGKLTRKDYKFRINPETGYLWLRPLNGIEEDSSSGRRRRHVADQLRGLTRWNDAKTDDPRWNKVRDGLDLPAMKSEALPAYEAEGDKKPFLLKESGI